MKNYFEVQDKTDGTKCRYSRRIPLDSQLTSSSNLGAATHGQPYWPVSFDPKFLKFCPCHGFQEMKTS